MTCVESVVHLSVFTDCVRLGSVKTDVIKIAQLLCRSRGSDAGQFAALLLGPRTDGIHNVDLSIHKEFSPKESMKLQLRADLFNLVNHPRFAPPDSSWDPGDTQFGIISCTAVGYIARKIQFGLRFEF
jgi:hypothetical protein